MSEDITITLTIEERNELAELVDDKVADIARAIKMTELGVRDFGEDEIILMRHRMGVLQSVLEELDNTIGSE